jgi:hypothetical protein
MSMKLGRVPSADLMVGRAGVVDSKEVAGGADDGNMGHGESKILDIEEHLKICTYAVRK